MEIDEIKIDRDESSGEELIDDLDGTPDLKKAKKNSPVKGLF